MLVHYMKLVAKEFSIPHGPSVTTFLRVHSFLCHETLKASTTKDTKVHEGKNIPRSSFVPLAVS